MILLFFYGLCNLLLGHIFDDVIFFLDPCVDVTCNDQGKVDTSTDACACLVYVFMVLLETIAKLKVIDFVIFLWFMQFTFRDKYLMILFSF